VASEPSIPMSGSSSSEGAASTQPTVADCVAISTTSNCAASAPAKLS
jgi:hypothetical protein